MVGFKGNVAVVIRCLNGLQLALIVDKPYGNAVHVLALCQGVRKRNGYVVFFTEVGNVFGSVVNGKVIDRATADLSKLILRQSEIRAVISLELVGGYGNVLIADRVNNAVIEADVCIIELNFLIGKVAGVYLVGLVTGINRYGFGFGAYGASIGSDTVYSLARSPIVSRRICGDLLGLFALIRTNAAFERLFAGGRAGCRLAYAGNVGMMIYRFARYFLAASAAQTNVYQNVLTTADVSFFSLRTGDIVSQCTTVILGIRIAAVAYVSLSCGSFAGCLGCQGRILNVNVRGYVFLTANVAIVIVIRFYVRAVLKNRTATIVTDMVVVRVRI